MESFEFSVNLFVCCNIILTEYFVVLGSLVLVFLGFKFSGHLALFTYFAE